MLAAAAVPGASAFADPGWGAGSPRAGGALAVGGAAGVGVARVAGEDFDSLQDAGYASSQGLEMVYAVVVPDPLSAPASLVAEAGNGPVALSWPAVVDADSGSSSVSSYEVRYSRRRLLGVWGIVSRRSPAALTETVTGLVNGTVYGFEVRAVNSETFSEWVSAEAAPTGHDPPDGAPGAPGGLVVAPGDGVLAVSWQAPADSGDSPVTGYEVRYRVASSGATSWTSLDGAVSGLSARIDGVVNLVPYDVQVRAVNTRGGGAWATATAGVLALVDAGNDDPAGMWSDGTTVYLGDNTDDKIYAYSVATGAHDASRDFQSLGPDVSHIGGIWADDETLYVVNPVGRALYAFDRATKLRDPGNDILRIGVPGPDYPYVTDVWSDGETLWILDSELDKLYAYNLETKQPRSHLDFDLSGTGSRLWSDGETVWIGDYESAAVVAYSLSAKSRDFGLDVQVPGGDMDALWSDGTTLWIVDSHTVEAVPLDRRPGPPGSLSVVGGDTELALAWQAAPDGLDGVGYEVQYRHDEGPSGWVDAVRDDPSALTETVAGLTNGAFHQVRVRAESVSGLTGRWSAAAGTPVVAGAPGAPLDLAAAGARETPAEGGGDRALVVEWEAPPGSGTVGYEARYRRGGSQASWTSAAVGSGRTARIAGLEKGALYEVQVRAVAGGLAGPWATAASRAGRGFYSIGPFAEGIWSDRETMWVSEWLNTHARIRAYDMATKERVPELDLNGLEASALRYPGPMWSDYAKLWVVNDSFFADRRVGAYDHDTGRPVDTALSGVGSVLDDAGNTAPAGIWGAGVAVWISDWRDNKIYVYNQNTGRRSHSLGFDLVEPYHEDDPQRSMSVAAGIWSNGVTMWVADKVQPRIYAYWMSDRSRAPEQDIVFASNVRLLDVFADLGEMFVLDDISSSIISLVLPYPPAVPRNLAVVSQDAALDVSWLGSSYGGSSEVTGYAVRYFDLEHPDEDVTVAPTSALSVSLTGLGNGRTYRVEVQAFNSESYSDWVGVSAAPVGSPGMVAGLFAAADNSALNVTWRAPGDDGGSTLAGYDVEYRAAGAASWTEHASATTALSARIVSLTNEQRYEVQVRARNGVHTGEWGTVTVAPLGVPAAPGAPSATSEDRELEISWAAPGNGGANPVTGYDIQYRAKDSPGSWTLDRSGVAAPSWTVDGLDNGVVYEVQVRARNSLGPGRWSPSGEAAPFTVPGAPAGVAASPGDEALVVQWDAPADDGGNAVLDYTVQYRTSSPQGQWVVDGDAVSGLTWTIDGLVNTTTYDVSVQARNAKGHGRAASAGAIPSAAPGLPRNVQTDSDNRALVVQWTAPADDGGSEVLDYTVQYRTSSPQGQWVVDGDAVSGLTWTIDGLVNGTAYDVSVQARNANGLGPFATTADTPLTVPGAPQTLTVSPADAELEVHWAAPFDDGGSTVATYRIQYRVTGSGSGWTVSEINPADSFSQTIGGLVNGRSYDVCVRAGNANGLGVCTEASAVPAARPGRPDNVETAGQNASVRLEWSPPAYTGGVPVSGYEVRYQAEGATYWRNVSASPQQSDPASWWVVVGSLTNGTPYRLQVRAVGPGGEGPWAQAGATTAAPPGSLAGLTVREGPGELVAQWAPPANARTSGIDEYQVEYRPKHGSQPWAPAEDRSDDGLTASISGLIGGTAYQVRARAVNFAGDAGPWRTAEGTPAMLHGLSISGAPAHEDAGTAAFVVSLSEASNWPVTVDYRTFDGTAESGTDYEPTSGTLTFNPGDSSKTFSVPIIDDSLEESSETIIAELSRPTNAVLSTQFEATAIILDDETLPPTTTTTPGPTTGGGGGGGGGGPATPTESVEIEGAGFAAAAASATFVAAGLDGDGSYTLRWTAAGPDGFTAAADSEEFVLAPPAAGAYTITVTVTNADGDTLTDTTTLTVLGDIAGHQFVNEILWLAEQGITAGCTAYAFCPNDHVSRGQMAAFLSRALELPAASVDLFDDDNSSTHENDINRLAQAGITQGCATRAYCPNDHVSRGQMAAFLSRALELPAASVDLFDDDNSSTHENDINRLAQAGITQGCASRAYCPNDHVSRGQMAAFLYRARHLIAAARTRAP